MGKSSELGVGPKLSWKVLLLDKTLPEKSN
jgi:hypothetical protein